jgi:integrase
MARRRTLTDDGVAALKSRARPYAYPDPEMAGLYVRVMPTGRRSFVAVVRDREKRQRWVTIGQAPAYAIDTARKRAGEIIRAVREGRSEPDSFERVAARWRELHCEARKLRSMDQIDRYLKRMTHAWTGRAFTSIGRGDVAKLLDQIESDSGERPATYALQVFSSLANWYAARDDNYRSPIVKGMRRGLPVKRDRILSDDEIRAIWPAAEANGLFGAFVRLLLLTGQRREKVSAMRWDDVSIDGVWTIQTEAREKGNAGELVLPEMALEIIKAQPRFASNPYVFPGSRDQHFKSWAHGKRMLDAKITAAGFFAPWTLHDLRRTARSLMSRAGVRPDVAERVLGHVIAGVEGIYDRHSYREEKAHALKALAGLIENILRPESARVRQLRG